MITLRTAKRLYYQCKAFEKEANVPDGEFRELTKKIFGKATVMTLNQMAKEVYKELAEAYMQVCEEDKLNSHEN